MASRIRILAAKPEDLSSIYRTHMVEGDLTPENCLLPPHQLHGIGSLTVNDFKNPTQKDYGWIAFKGAAIQKEQGNR